MLLLHCLKVVLVSAVGFNLESFTNLMLRKMSASDEDDEIRSIFLAFDAQCKIWI